MTRPYVMVGDHPASRIEVHVPGRGAWFADVVFEGDPNVSGSVVIRIGDLEMSGVIDARHFGTRGLQGMARVLAGGGGWGRLLPAKGYHNDSGVRARTVADDAAREAGERIGEFTPAAERIGKDYVREAGVAARVLEDAIGGASWWVGYDGVTNVGERVESTPENGSYEVLDYAPSERTVDLATDDVGAVVVGSRLSEGLDEPQVVHGLEICVTEDLVRVRAWCGGDVGGDGRVTRALRRFVRRVTDDRYYGLVRYRVVQMSSDRVELQAVRRDAGFPDIRPISMWPGAAGYHAALTPGAEVLVQFIEGDRRFPIITHFAGKDGNGWTPANVTIDATTQVKLGQNATSFVALATLTDARLSDLQTAHDAHTHAHGDPNTGPPSTIVGALGSVAAAKVRAE